nr:choice-of-anchor D domain-containing protein [Terriglobales bacterium]
TSTGVAVADLNGDGNADLVVANNVPSGTVSVLLGLGNGLFQPQIAYGAAPYTYSVALADFNQDGKVDIAVNGQDYAGILLGNGDGTFQHVALYLVREGASHSILAADVNSDGIQDLAVGGSSTVYILLGKGDGSFKMPSTAFTGGPVDSIVAGDFNEDGNLDFATSSSIRSSFYVLLGQGDGRTFHKYLSFGTGSAKPSLSIGDFNNDGYPDLCAGGAVLFQTTVAVKPTTLAFPDTYIGQSSAAQTVTLSNYAAAPLPITSITISSQGTSYSQTNTCGSSVPANGTCTVSVIFAPREAGLLTGTLKLEEPVLNSPQAVTLSGNALQRIVPMVTLDPPILTFGSQKVGTTSSPQFITLTNSGTAKLTISGIAASGDFAQTNTCGTTLLVDQNCTLIVTFTPNATGTRTGAIPITDNAPGGTQSVPLTGTGTN